MKYYKSNTNEYYAAKNLLDALAAAQHKHPKTFIFLLPIDKSKIPSDAKIIETGEII
jgi:hypothetical protein